MRKSILNTLLIAGLVTTGIATTIHVPGDQPTIQAGIDTSTDGDTVLVQPGVYQENIDFLGKGIFVSSCFIMNGQSAFIDSTIITSASGYATIGFHSDEDSTSILSGFTVTGSHNGYGGIDCCQGSPRLEYLKVIDNSTSNPCGGGGITIHWAAPQLYNILISGNTSLMGDGGGGIGMLDSDATLENLIITNNSAPC